MTRDIDYKESEYEELRRLGQKLHIPIAEAFWEIEVIDRDGNIVKQHRQRSHSWVRNAYNHLFSQMAAVNCLSADGLSVRDTGGTFRSGSWPVGYSDYSLNFKTDNHGYKAAAADTTRGIVVGTGSDPEDFEDYALGSQIANGTGAGQLSYIASEVYTISTVGTVKKNELVRYFNNNSGGDVNVNEVGLVAYGTLTDDTARKFMMSRDVLASTVTVPNTGQLKVTYTIQLAYPA